MLQVGNKKEKKIAWIVSVTFARNKPLYCLGANLLFIATCLPLTVIQEHNEVITISGKTCHSVQYIGMV